MKTARALSVGALASDVAFVEAFFSASIPEPNTGCWLWEKQASKTHDYGAFSLPGVGSVRAHRLAFALVNGDVPDGIVVRHRCDNPACVNPDHLELGTQRENVSDRYSRGRFVGNPAVQKLDEATAKAIFESEDSSAATARKFGVSPTLVKSIRRREIWGHVNLGQHKSTWAASRTRRGVSNDDARARWLTRREREGHLTTTTD